MDSLTPVVTDGSSPVAIQAAQAAIGTGAPASTPEPACAAPAAHWAGIPADLRALPQWCVAATNKSPLTPVAGLPLVQLPRASINAPSTWGTFLQAATVAYQLGQHIGFVLEESDPFCCIDLDVKPGITTQEELARYGRIVQHFDSWTERSRSGHGLHVWLRGKLPNGNGARHEGVEVYSQQRFMIVTGNAVHAVPIAERQAMLDILVDEIRGQQGCSNHTSPLTPEQADVPQTRTVDEIKARWAAAKNAKDIEDLWFGRWRDLRRDNGKRSFPSQSEADLALVTHILFHDATNAQCKQMWAESALCPSRRPPEKRKANPQWYMRNTIERARQNRVRDAMRAAKDAEAFAPLLNSLAPSQT